LGNPTIPALNIEHPLLYAALLREKTNRFTRGDAKQVDPGIIRS
jgi:hypothetical protein